jgi:NRPS condensation-like uncharacterized protein
MTKPSLPQDQKPARYPLSFTQEWFLTLDQGDDGGPFGRRYLLVSPVRITGLVDLAVLRGALDDVVARHELLRTLVVRDADPPYQLVCPPCPVPLEVRDLPPVTGTSRDMVIQELIVEAQAGTISAREVPLLHARLCRFDDRDSVLVLTVHHSVSDGWSVQVILRDLGAFYAARVTGTAPKLAEMRQYREYAQWQRANASTPDDGALKYWAEQLDGAREFAMPNDHGHPERYSRPYSLHVFGIEAGTMAAAAALANATRSTQFTVMLSAIYVLANQLTGATDLTVRAVTAGRNELAFHNTMGLFLNVVPFRTEIAGCTSFRDIVRKTRETFIDAMANELPIGVLEQAFPDYIRSREDTRTSELLILQPPSQYGEMILPIAEGAREIDDVVLEEAESTDIPSGTQWHLSTQPDGALSGSVHFNLDEFGERTVKGWTAGFKRILASAVRDPGQDWTQLPASPGPRNREGAAAFAPCEREGTADSLGMADMTESSLALDQEPARYPLSSTQEWFIALDQGDDGGTFGSRFLMNISLRITGHVDLTVLQGALDDVVARHELLRTLVIRDADPPYQKVLPPCQVPLEVRDLPPVTGTSRDRTVQELIVQAEAGSTINAREVPLMRALLCKFDDRDSALFVTVHHSVTDAWSIQVILRDLGAFYLARRTGTEPELPPMRQYREYAAWQKANATSTADDGAPRYWQHKLDGAREFTMPNDHGHPDSYSRPYSLHVHRIEPEVMNGVSALATATRSTQFTVRLSAFYVLAHQLTGRTDLAVRAFTAGRSELEFHNTMGLFLNCVPFRTDIAGCATFRDIVLATRETFIDAMAYELPVNVIEQAFPGFIKSREDLRTSQFIISDIQKQLGDDPVFPIAEGARAVSERLSQRSEHQDIPSGAVWYLSAEPSGELNGSVQFNLDEFDESTVAGWSAELRRILADAVREPDRDWRLLSGPASRHENRV